MKVLPILNAIGCLFLVGFIVVQWKGAQVLDKQLRAAKLSERNIQNEKVEVEQRVIQLQVDVDTLKGSIESMKLEAEAAKKKISEHDELVQHLHTALSFNFAYFNAFDQALADRDKAIADRNSRISDLNTSLVATRKRLDEAIDELKKAGAQ